MGHYCSFSNNLFFYFYRPRTKYEGRYCFHRCLSINISRGYPVPGLRRYPIQVWMVGDTPSQVWGGGVNLSRSGGYPIPGLGWGRGYPIQVWMVGGTPSWGVCQPGLDGGGYLEYPQLGLGYSPGMGYPLQTWDGYLPQHQDLAGVPPPLWDGVPPPTRQSSIASTCYAAASMPLAFTQKDFLVLFNFPLQFSLSRLISDRGTRTLSRSGAKTSWLFWISPRPCRRIYRTPRLRSQLYSEHWEPGIGYVCLITAVTDPCDFAIIS